MITVKTYPMSEIDGKLIKYCVIGAKYGDKWIYSKHRERDTLEIPGGHIEVGEKPMECARRELYEETGALDFEIEPVCVYSVLNTEKSLEDSFGVLFFASVTRLGELPPLEIEKIELLEGLPPAMTYPKIQPHLFEKLLQHIEMKQASK